MGGVMQLHRTLTVDPANSPILQEIYGDDGFFIADILDAHGLHQLRTIVNDKFHSVIKLKYPDLYQEFEGLSIDQYHTRSNLIDHANTWRKAMRTFDRKLVDRFLELPWKARLAEIVGPFELLGLEEAGLPDIYMRLVRPNEPKDIGPMHADQWFTDLGNHQIDPKLTLAKVWIPIYSDPVNDGLTGVPGSHLRRDELHYDSELRDGYVKPVLPERVLNSINPIRLMAKPGQAVSFTYDFLHGGSVNAGTDTRVSLELTLILTRDQPLLTRDQPLTSGFSRRIDPPASGNRVLGEDWRGGVSQFLGAVLAMSGAGLKHRLQLANLELPETGVDLGSQYDSGKLALLKSLAPAGSKQRILMFGSDWGITPCLIAGQLSDDSTLTVVESARQVADVTTRNIGRNKLDGRVSVVQGDYQNIVRYLDRSSPYDLIILDHRGHHLVVDLLSWISAGGRMLVDGLLEDLAVLNPLPTTTRGKQAKELLNTINSRDELVATLLPISSGVLLVVRA
jgi:predicted O-methyltransferase YrrM